MLVEECIFTITDVHVYKGEYSTLVRTNHPRPMHAKFFARRSDFWQEGAIVRRRFERVDGRTMPESAVCIYTEFSGKLYRTTYERIG